MGSREQKEMKCREIPKNDTELTNGKWGCSQRASQRNGSVAFFGGENVGPPNRVLVLPKGFDLLRHLEQTIWGCFSFSPKRQSQFLSL